MSTAVGGDDYDGEGGRRTEVVGLDVHTMDARPAAGSSKWRGSLRQSLEDARRRRGKGDTAAWSSTSASMVVVLWHARGTEGEREHRGSGENKGETEREGSDGSKSR